MTTTTAAELDPAEQYATDRNRLWLTTTAALTAAARLTHPTGRQLDFAEFLADSLAAVTANLGGVEELLAGRSGSWEAALVDQLVNGTLGYDPDDAELTRRRTEPVPVRLNVASLVDEHAAPGNGPFIDAMDALDARYAQASTEAEHEALDLAAGELHRDWTDRYTAYADRFAAAVHAAATRLGVTVPVTVKTSADPDNVYGEPDNTGDPGWADRPTDLLAWQLWRAGLDAHPVAELTGPSDHQTPLPVAARYGPIVEPTRHVARSTPLHPLGDRSLRPHNPDARPAAPATAGRRDRHTLRKEPSCHSSTRPTVSTSSPTPARPTWYGSPPTSSTPAPRPTGPTS